MPKPRDAAGMAQARQAKAEIAFRKREEALQALHAVGNRAAATLAEGLDAEKLVLDRHGNLRSIGPDQPERRQSAVAILDRIGIGPSSSVEVDVDASIHLLQLIKTLDEDEIKARAITVDAVG